jgi:hypothetical protein
VSVEKKQVTRYEIAMPDPECPDHVDRLWAERPPHMDQWGQWWTICGDNTGSESLVVHEYMIEPLIELLLSLPRGEEVDGA